MSQRDRPFDAQYTFWRQEMNFVFISPNFPAAYERFCVGLHENGVNVLGIGDAPYDSLSGALKYALTEYYRVDDMKNYDQMVRAMGHLTANHGKIDWVESNNEYWMELDAALRTDFNVVSGLKSDQIMRYRSKTAMKKYYAKAGVPTARYSQVVDLETAQKTAASGVKSVSAARFTASIVTHSMRFRVAKRSYSFSKSSAVLPSALICAIVDSMPSR